MKTIKEYLKMLSDAGFEYKETKDLYEIYKYGERFVLMWSDFNDDIVKLCEEMTSFKHLKYDHIERYAISLYHFGIKKTYKEAYKESLRWHKKEYQCFVEPIPCRIIYDDRLLNKYRRKFKLERILK